MPVCPTDIIVPLKEEKYKAKISEWRLLFYTKRKSWMHGYVVPNTQMYTHKHTLSHAHTHTHTHTKNNQSQRGGL